MPSYNKGTLDAYRKIVTKDIYARNLTLTGSLSMGGNLVVTGSISGSSLQSPSAVITNITGSNMSLNGNLYVDGNISGSFFYDTITATFISGSQRISGSNYIGDNLTVTNVTGSSILSGSNIYGYKAIITNATATNITGSTLVSGSDFRGPTATITNLYVMNVSGSGNISGSTIIASQGLTKPASYVIYSGSFLGGPYFAENGSTGKVIYSGSNPTTVINNTINDLTSGSIIVFKDSLNLTSPINPKGNSYIILDGNNVCITYVGLSATIFAEDCTYTTIKNFNIYASGSDSLAYGIWLHDCSYCNVENNIVDNIPSAGIWIQSTSNIVNGIHVLNNRVTTCGLGGISGFGIGFNDNSGSGGYNLIQGNYVENTFTSGIKLYSLNDNSKIINNTIINPSHGGIHGYGINEYGSNNCLIEGNIINCLDGSSGSGIGINGVNVVVNDNEIFNSLLYGISITTGSNGCIVTNNLISGSNSEGINANMVSLCTVDMNTIIQPAAYSIELISISGSSCSNNKILNSTSRGIVLQDSVKTLIANNVAHISTYGCIETGTSDYNLIVDNNFTSILNFGLLITGSNTIARNNMGNNSNYICENKGYTTINNSSGSFAHGLRDMPTSVIMTTSGSIPLELSWLPSGSTGVWVYHNGTPPVGVYWKAEV